MTINGKPKIVLLGMISKTPVAGAIWGTLQYLLGFRRLGFDVYYVEAHARSPTMLMTDGEDNSSWLAAAFIADIMQRFDFDHKWAYHALHADGHCYGMSWQELKQLYQSADAIINYHGSTRPRPEHQAARRLVLLETDPVDLEIELYEQVQDAIDFLAPHSTVFTWGENYGNADCDVPLPDDVTFHPTRAPVVMDNWQTDEPGGDTFTTVGNWRQPWREVSFRGEVYTWSKHVEFLKFLELPRFTSQAFELTLDSFEPDDQELLERNGWRVRPARDLSRDLAAYRRYIIGSRGEFTVAKDQNVRLRSGWFSERSAQYLAAGRPVITQDTGFSNVLPTGTGLFGFSTLDDILQAVDEINVDYDRHSEAAAEIAREYFRYDKVLPKMLDAIGLAPVV